MSDEIDEANRIKDRLRKCETAAEVATVADEERANVHALRDKSDLGRTMAIHIANLKAWCLSGLKTL